MTTVVDTTVPWDVQINRVDSGQSGNLNSADEHMGLTKHRPAGYVHTQRTAQI